MGFLRCIVQNRSSFKHKQTPDDQKTVGFLFALDFFEKRDNFIEERDFNKDFSSYPSIYLTATVTNEDFYLEKMQQDTWTALLVPVPSRSIIPQVALHKAALSGLLRHQDLLPRRSHGGTLSRPLSLWKRAQQLVARSRLPDKPGPPPEPSESLSPDKPESPPEPSEVRPPGPPEPPSPRLEVRPPGPPEPPSPPTEVCPPGPPEPTSPPGLFGNQPEPQWVKDVRSIMERREPYDSMGCKRTIKAEER
ncbi:proline-rich receptor-like protein kinase PERK9 [Lates japonicus]|uniref:Proline-rich receptor-like protein kinase PERK9 n=1 Tax=Lates japonicus TaxID=270547 RepID=A0AAD3RGX8_LATJO|nr:proline-rich receptor-like protein kinase PERK9 [Lates japonicus]